MFGWGSANTYYNWKKEKRPVISLLEKYFTKEDLEEFLEYGTIERYEFSYLKDFEKRASEFAPFLASLVQVHEKSGDEPEIVIDYFAYATYEGLDRLIGNSSKQAYGEILIRAYDEYKKNKDFSSWLLGELLYNFNNHYPEYEGYEETIWFFIENNFLPLVKICSKYYPQYIDLVIKFCIKFNLYKYNKYLNFEDIYIKTTNINLEYDQDLGSLKFKLNYEKFKKEIQKIQQS